MRILIWKVMDNYGSGRPSVLKTTKTLLKEDGWWGFYRGFGPRFLNMSLYGTTMIVTYEMISMSISQVFLLMMGRLVWIIERFMSVFMLGPFLAPALIWKTETQCYLSSACIPWFMLLNYRFPCLRLQKLLCNISVVLSFPVLRQGSDFSLNYWMDVTRLDFGIVVAVNT